MLRTPRGAAMVVNGIEGTNFEKIVCVGARTATTTAQQLKGATGPVAVKLWHMLSDWRDEGDDEDAIRERMIRRADAEHTRIRALSGCKHWLQLIADVAAEKEALIGSVPYPAIYLEHFPGQVIDRPMACGRPSSPPPACPCSEEGGRGGRKVAHGSSASLLSDRLASLPSPSPCHGTRGEQRCSARRGGGQRCQQRWRRTCPSRALSAPSAWCAVSGFDGAPHHTAAAWRKAGR